MVNKQRNMAEETVCRDVELRIIKIGKLEMGKVGELKGDPAHDYRILFVHRGKGSIIIGEYAFPISNGYAYLFPLHTKPIFHISRDDAFYDLQFQVDSKELIELMAKAPCRIPAAWETDEWLRWLDMRSSSLLRDLGLKQTLLSLVMKWLMISSELGKKEHRSAQIHSIMKYMQEHFADPLTLREVAKHFGFHPHYLIRMFNLHVGISPMQYLQEVRLMKGMEYLSVTQCTVAEISEKLGWTTSYFSRKFHERIGMSPTDYRKQQTRKLEE